MPLRSAWATGATTPGPGQSRATHSLFHAGIHGEDIDQACDFQDPADLLLRGSQGQVTTTFPGSTSAHAPVPQAAGVDELQTRQVHDD
jgi:hypothetical protein